MGQNQSQQPNPDIMLQQAQTNNGPECNTQCQHQKRLQELKNNYDSAVKDETKDSAQARQARKAYLTFKLGEGGYRKKEEQLLKTIADKHTSKLKHVHDSIVSEIEEHKEIAINNKIAIKNMREHLGDIRLSNEKIMDGLDKQEDTLETSRRKVWYTNHSIEGYRFYDRIISMVLRILLLVAIVFFIYDMKYTSLAVVIVIYLLIRHFL